MQSFIQAHAGNINRHSRATDLLVAVLKCMCHTLKRLSKHVLVSISSCSARTIGISSRWRAMERRAAPAYSIGQIFALHQIEAIIRYFFGWQRRSGTGKDFTSTDRDIEFK
jgi:hypothetical protein